MKKLSKLLILALALMTVLALTGCNQPAPTPTPTPDPQPEETGFAPVAKEDLKVGIIYIGSATDKGWTYSHDQGMLAMQASLELDDSQVIKKEFITEDSACETALRELVEAGCQIIFANSWGYMDYMEEMAEEYPEIIFSHCSGYKNNGINFNNYFGAINDARYLSGIAAGLKTETNKIGYVGAYKNPEVISGANAFALGVASVNPDAEILFTETQTWFNPDLEKSAAISLLDKGCDVIAQHQDTTMPQIAAQERGVFSIGYHVDMTEDAPAAHMTAPVWDWSGFYTDSVQAVIDGTWTPDNYYGDMKDGLVNLSPLTENCAEGTEEQVNAAKEAILDGSLVVFSGPITDNEGNVAVAEGEVLDREGVDSMMWFVSNIIVQ